MDSTNRGEALHGAAASEISPRTRPCGLAL